MMLISPLLKHVVYPFLSRSGYFRHVAERGGLCVVTYHGVSPKGYRSSDSFLDANLISPLAFRNQLRWLKAHYRVISPEVALAWLEKRGELPSRAVLLTCDDGLLNNLTDMLPILRDEGLSCLFFVTGMSAAEMPRTLWYEDLYRMLMATGVDDVSFEELGIRTNLGSPAHRRVQWWEMVRALSKLDEKQRDCLLLRARDRLGVTRDTEEDRSDQRRRFSLLTRHELETLAASGMTIGAHTMSHPVLAQQSPEGALLEMQASRRALENALGKRVWAFAYPFGDPTSVTEREVALAREAGFECAFLNYGGGFGAGLPNFALPRIHVSAAMGMGEFDAQVSGFYRALRGTPRVIESSDSPGDAA